jgi:hypothetical protein
MGKLYIFVCANSKVDDDLVALEVCSILFLKETESARENIIYDLKSIVMTVHGFITKV